MEDLVLSLLPYVNGQTLTVFGCVAILYAGWRVGGRAVSGVSSIVSSVGIAPVAALVLFLGGVGSAFYGVGEFVNNIRDNNVPKATTVGLTDENLLTLAKDAKDPNVAQAILDYAKSRDSGNEMKSQTLANLVTMANEKNKEAVVAFINYLKVKEERATMQDVANNFVATTTTGVISEEKTMVAATSPSATIPMQWSLSMIGLGIASTLSGGLIFRIRYRSPAKV